MDDDILEARKSWVDKMVAWQKEHISDRQMTLILAFVIGVLASVAGYFLHGKYAAQRSEAVRGAVEYP